MNNKSINQKVHFFCTLGEKIPIAMRITLLFLFVLIFQLQAEQSYSQNTKISLDVRNNTIEKILQTIEERSEYYFLYNSKLINVDRKTNIRANEESIASVLDRLFDRENVEYEVKGNQIILHPKEMNQIAFDLMTNIKQHQKKQISGKIIDERGEPIIGANIIETGTTNGTVTDIGGNFSLDIEDNAVMRVSYIGYLDQEINTSDQQHFHITLIEDTQALDELVVVGYGVQQKINLTGAISTISFDEELQNRPITNASQALSGKVPGVWVSQNSGQPGSDGAQIRVRGWGTLNNSNPLIIIDGVEGEFNQVNPNDIESITVLKDAASSAIYGSKAANGVVLITTKMGRREQKMEVNFSSYVGMQTLGKTYDVIDNSAEFMRMWNTGLTNQGVSPLFPDYLIDEFENATDIYKYPNTNFYRVFFENALMQEYNLSLSGGISKSSLFFNLNYMDHTGMIPNTDSNRFGIRVNFENEVNDWLRLTGRLNYRRKNNNEPYTWGNLWQSLTIAPPFTAPYTKEGKFGSVQAIDKDGNLLYDNRNPFIDAANGRTITEDNSFVTNISAQVRFLKNLILNTTLSTTNNWSLSDKYNETIYGYTDTGIETITLNYNRAGIEVSRAHQSSVANRGYSTLNYQFKKNNHDVSTLLGLQIESERIKDLFARRSNPPKEGLTQVDAGTDGIQGSGNMIGIQMLSYLGRINYSFKDKYLFEANFRADASSRFSKSNRWGFFPGFSAGWRLIEEPFIRDLNIFSNLKLITSWGQLGNQNIAGYWPYLTVIDQNNNLSYSYNDSFSPGAATTSLVDENITWETTTSFNLGVEMGFANNKVNLSADYFTKKTNDILVQLPIPSMMGGLTPPFENVGEMSNNGIELSILFDNSTASRNLFGYNISANLTYIDNEITKFQGGNSPDQLYLIREGYSFRELYGYKSIGVYNSDSEAQDHMHSNSPVPKAGNLKYEDLNNDGKIDYQDKQSLGNTIPKYTFGLSGSFQYKGFELSLLLQGVADVNAYTNNLITNMGTNTGVITKKWRNAWTPENQNTRVPSLKFDDSWDNLQSSFWINEASFLKLKNIQLGYTFKEKIIKNINLNNLHVYINAQNVFTLVNKDYEGMDPERNTFDSGNQVYPTPRIFSFGINLTF